MPSNIIHNLLNKSFGKLQVISKKPRLINETGPTKWICVCSCGQERICDSASLRNGKNTACLACIRHPLWIDLSGKQIGNWQILSWNKNNAKWVCQCICGTQRDISSGVLHSNTRQQCSNCLKQKRKNKKNIKYGTIYFWKLKGSAKHRKISFGVTRDYLIDLFIKQNFKCVLTGLDIVLYTDQELCDGKTNTASLDRIDSSIGYEIGNVQWVHRKINIMKFDLPQNEFLMLCKNVTSFNYNSSQSNI